MSNPITSAYWKSTGHKKDDLIDLVIANEVPGTPYRGETVERQRRSALRLKTYEDLTAMLNKIMDEMEV